MLLKLFSSTTFLGIGIAVILPPTVTPPTVAVPAPPTTGRTVVVIGVIILRSGLAVTAVVPLLFLILFARMLPTMGLLLLLMRSKDIGLMLLLLMTIFADSMGTGALVLGTPTPLRMFWA